MYKDLRGFIKQVDELGALRRVRGADPKFELGGITEVAAGTAECPALLFDRIKGYERGVRVFTNATTTAQRAALALGIDPGLKPLDALKAWMKKRQTLAPQRPVDVDKAAFDDNVMRGKNVDMTKLPAPYWHRKDGGPYIGSGSIVIMRDPDGGWINASIYRIQVHGKNKVTVQFDHQGRHGAIIAKKYWDRGKTCPVAVVNGEDPALFIAGFEYLPDGQSEYDFAGSIKGAPFETMRGPLTGLPLPALAEIILKASLAREQKHAAGRPVRRVHRRLRHRCAARAGDAGERGLSSRRSDPAGLAADEAAAIPFRAAVPRRLDLEQPGDGRRHRRGRRLAARRAAHDRGRDPPALCRPRQRAALIAAANSYMGRLVVVVDEDVDPSNLADVMWAITTRCEPAEQIDIVRNAGSSALDPRIPDEFKQAGITSHSKAIIEAVRPFGWKDRYRRPRR